MCQPFLQMIQKIKINDVKTQNFRRGEIQGYSKGFFFFSSTKTKVMKKKKCFNHIMTTYYIQQSYQIHGGISIL